MGRCAIRTHTRSPLHNTHPDIQTHTNTQHTVQIALCGEYHLPVVRRLLHIGSVRSSWELYRSPVTTLTSSQIPTLVTHMCTQAHRLPLAHAESAFVGRGVEDVRRHPPTHPPSPSTASNSAAPHESFCFPRPLASSASKLPGSVGRESPERSLSTVSKRLIRLERRADSVLTCGSLRHKPNCFKTKMFTFCWSMKFRRCPYQFSGCSFPVCTYNYAK